MIEMGTEILIKFGKYEHMKNLFEKGEIFMNNLSFYRKEENNQERYDSAEAAEYIMQMKGAKIIKKNPMNGLSEVLANVTDGVGYVRNSRLDSLNVFCMFYIQGRDGLEVQFKDLVDSRVRDGFGDAAVIVWDAASFVTRIKDACERLGLEHYRALVKYIDLSNWHGKVGPFIKDLSFSYQNELRIAVFDKELKCEARTITIGGISDISIFVPTEDIEKMAIEWSNAD